MNENTATMTSVAQILDAYVREGDENEAAPFGRLVAWTADAWNGVKGGAGIGAISVLLARMSDLHKLAQLPGEELRSLQYTMLDKTGRPQTGGPRHWYTLFASEQATRSGVLTKRSADVKAASKK